MVSGQRFQLEGQGPAAYEQYLVPTFFTPCAEQLLALAPPQAGHRVLDVACGTGIVARLASSTVGAAGRVVGVDVNDGMLAQARASAAEAACPITWQTGDAASLGGPDGSFDVVYCQQGLQFLPDRPGALAEMHRVLAPGGRVAVAVWRDIEHQPAFASLISALERQVGAEAAAMMRSPFSGPGREQIRDLLAAAGFTDPTVRIGVLSARFPSASAFLREEALSSPLAGPVGALDDQQYAALDRDVVEALAGHVDDDGLVFPMQTWLATGIGSPPAAGG
jgi:ubiquinone/menaquinone biosynthesis C-methylase UbiE